MNKFTRKIDELFAKYDPEGKADKIYLGYCHEGDEDGGCDDYDYVCTTCWWERGNLPHKQRAGELFEEFCDNTPIGLDEENYRTDWVALCRMLLSSFGKELKPDFDGTNCYYHRYYFITKDYKICCYVSRSCDSDHDDTEVLGDVSALSEEDAKNAEDNQVLQKLIEYASDIKYQMSRIKSDEFKEKARKAIQDAIK